LASDPTKPVRRRRSAETARAEAVHEARKLLMESGPQAVTLKGVAEPLGMSHVNLIHHFGSAEGLQTALMRSMASELRVALSSRDYDIHDLDTARRFVDLVFDAFHGGAGKLTAWIALSGDEAVMDQLAQMVADVASDERDPSVSAETRATNFVTILSLALADSLAGAVMRKALDLPTDGARDIAARLVLNTLQRP
jgi:AcrR family transcriptional regulator